MTAQEQRQAAQSLMKDAGPSSFTTDFKMAGGYTDPSGNVIPTSTDTVMIFANKIRPTKSGKASMIKLIDLIDLADQLPEIIGNLLKEAGGEA